MKKSAIRIDALVALILAGSSMTVAVPAASSAASGEEQAAQGGVGDTQPPFITGLAPFLQVDEFESLVVTATADDSFTGNSNIVNIQYQLDDNGIWIGMAPVDGAFDEPVEEATTTLQFPTSGDRNLNVRAIDQGPNLAFANATIVVGDANDTTAPTITVLITIPVFPPPTVGEPVTLQISADDGPTGNHPIASMEYQIDGGNWVPVAAPIDGTWDYSHEHTFTDIVFNNAGLRTVCGRATDSVANTSSPTCHVFEVLGDPDQATIRLRAIEVNQVIQNWRNEIPLIQNKDTAVRLFFEKIDPQAPNFANGLLHGTRGGQALPGSPLVTGTRSNVGDDATAFTLIDDEDSDTDADDDVESYRGELINSLNFLLPFDWISQADTVELEFELTSPLFEVLECAEPDGNPDCKVSVAFETAERPVIEFFSVPYRRNEVQQLTIDATGGSYTFVSGNRESDPVAWDADTDAIEDAIEDALNTIDKRVLVVNGRDCGTAPSGVSVPYTIFLLRGQTEVLSVDDSELTAGSADLQVCQTGGGMIAPTDADLREQMRRVGDLFPVSSVDYALRDLAAFDKAPTLTRVNTRLSKQRLWDQANLSYIPGSKSFALLLERGQSGKTGEAWLEVSATYARDAKSPTAGGVHRNTGGHEAAHNFGRAHAVVFDQGLLGSIGLCGSKYNDIVSPLHPFVEDTGIENTAAATIDESLRFTWPTIGPLSSGPDAEIWGFSPRAFVNGPDFSHLAIVDPRVSAELMSYCNPPRARQDMWVSSFSYQKLRQRLGGRSSVEARAGEGLGSGEYFLISGSIDGETEEVELDTAIRITGSDPGNEPGELHVALVDGVGTEISASDVALLIDGDHGSLSFGVGPEDAGFSAAVEIPSGATPAGIEISLESKTIAQVMASANAPTLEITSPTNATVAADTIPLAWTADDIDGDPLSASVLLSLDNGLSWETLMTDYEGSAYDFPVRFLSASTEARVRVLVSDGFHSTEVMSDAFELDAGYPTVGIEVPVSGIAVPTNEILHLRGDGWDPEDGLLEGASLVWTADEGGPMPQQLGTGTAVDSAAAQLPTGCQTITFRATDSDGRSATDTVEVDIGGTGCLGLFFADGFETGDLTGWSNVSP